MREPDAHRFRVWTGSDEAPEVSTLAAHPSQWIATTRGDVAMTLLRALVIPPQVSRSQKWNFLVT